jgi:hypothetical protein
VNELAGIFFHVDPQYTDPFLIAININIKIALLANGFLILGDLVSLGEIRIVIIFPGKNALPVYGAMKGKAQLYGKGYNLFVEDR